MKKNSPVGGITSIAVAIIVVIGFFIIMFNQKTTETHINNYGTGSETSTGGNILTGMDIDFGSGNENLTGDIEKEPTDEEKYISYKDKGNYRSFYPASQGRTNGDYATNTSFMVNYLSNNTFQFNLPKIPTNGYLYIRLKNPTTNTVFVYFHNTKINGYTVSGDLDKDKSLIESDSEMLFKLDDISYIPYHKKNIESFDWQSKMKQGNNNYIAGFVRDYNGANKIEEITIAWE